jgi:hypothetical protein
MDLFDMCTRFEIRGFVEDQLARTQMKELGRKSRRAHGIAMCQRQLRAGFEPRHGAGIQ